MPAAVPDSQPEINTDSDCASFGNGCNADEDYRSDEAYGSDSDISSVESNSTGDEDPNSHTPREADAQDPQANTADLHPQHKPARR